MRREIDNGAGDREKESGYVLRNCRNATSLLQHFFFSPSLSREVWFPIGETFRPTGPFGKAARIPRGARREKSKTKQNTTALASRCGRGDFPGANTRTNNKTAGPAGPLDKGQ